MLYTDCSVSGICIQVLCTYTEHNHSFNGNNYTQSNNTFKLWVQRHPLNAPLYTTSELSGVELYVHTVSTLACMHYSVFYACTYICAQLPGLGNALK